MECWNSGMVEARAIEYWNVGIMECWNDGRMGKTK
jgi:hypothetical protein